MAFVRVCEADLARGGGEGGRAELLRLLLSTTSVLACDVRTAHPSRAPPSPARRAADGGVHRAPR